MLGRRRRFSARMPERGYVDAIFGSGSELAWYQECARAALIFVYGLVPIRIAGRRIFGKWSALDIVVSIIIGSNLSRALTGGAQLWGTLVATMLLVALHWMLALLVGSSPGVSRVVEGGPVELARQAHPSNRSGRATRSARRISTRRCARPGWTILPPQGLSRWSRAARLPW